MHSLVVVFIPLNTGDIHEKVEEIMAPFDAELEKDEYEEDCDCLSSPVTKEEPSQSAVQKEPDPDCEQCEGTGKYTVYCNYDGFWDW